MGLSPIIHVGCFKISDLLKTMSETVGLPDYWSTQLKTSYGVPPTDISRTLEI